MTPQFRMLSTAGTAILVASTTATAAAQSVQTVAVDSFSAPLEVQSHGATLRGTIRVAAGAGSHATVVFLKGLPDVDEPAFPRFAQAEGFNGVSVSFRGQHRSDGQYTIEGTVEDAHALVEFLRSETARRLYRVDPERIVVVSASGGTLAALQTVASDPGLRCVAVMVPFNWTQAAQAARSDSSVRKRIVGIVASMTVGPKAPIRVSSDFTAHLLANAELYDIRRAGANLHQRVVFLIGAQQDDVAVLSVNHDPLLQAIRTAGPALLRDTLVADGHALALTQQDVFAAIGRWLRTDCRP